MKGRAGLILSAVAGVFGGTESKGKKGQHGKKLDLPDHEKIMASTKPIKQFKRNKKRGW